ncbi:MAG: hypothetical protein U0167_15435 [bacterium]
MSSAGASRWPRAHPEGGAADLVALEDLASAAGADLLFGATGVLWLGPRHPGGPSVACGFYEIADALEWARGTAR